MSNPCSDLFPPWPMGKSSAIRAGGASFITVVIILRIIAGATERRLPLHLTPHVCQTFKHIHQRRYVRQYWEPREGGRWGRIVWVGEQLAWQEKCGDSKAVCVHLQNKGEGGGMGWRAKWVINWNNGSGGGEGERSSHWTKRNRCWEFWHKYNSNVWQK